MTSDFKQLPDEDKVAKGELGPVLLLGGPRYSSVQWFSGSDFD